MVGVGSNPSLRSGLGIGDSEISEGAVSVGEKTKPFAVLRSCFRAARSAARRT
jgi:hypothetical protein